MTTMPNIYTRGLDADYRLQATAAASGIPPHAHSLVLPTPSATSMTAVCATPSGSMLVTPDRAASAAMPTPDVDVTSTSADLTWTIGPLPTASWAGMLIEVRRASASSTTGIHQVRVLETATSGTSRIVYDAPMSPYALVDCHAVVLAGTSHTLTLIRATPSGDPSWRVRIWHIPMGSHVHAPLHQVTLLDASTVSQPITVLGYVAPTPWRYLAGSIAIGEISGTITGAQLQVVRYVGAYTHYSTLTPWVSSRSRVDVGSIMLDSWVGVAVVVDGEAPYSAEITASITLS